MHVHDRPAPAVASSTPTFGSGVTRRTFLAALGVASAGSAAATVSLPAHAGNDAADHHPA